MNGAPVSFDFTRTTEPRLKSILSLAITIFVLAGNSLLVAGPAQASPRERILIDDDWRFIKDDPTNNTVSLLYDVRRSQTVRRFASEADGNSTLNQSAGTNESTNVTAVIKQWILPTRNEFIKDPTRKFVRPEGNLGDGVACVQPGFDDSSWQHIHLPHDWAIDGPFTHSGGGGMGRLPTAGVGWYRKKLTIPATDSGKSIFLDVDGAMSCAVVWLNGQLVGGWPYGYASWRVDLTPYAKPGGENELVIRLDNPPNSSRWYPGGGIYRNVWLVKTSPVHVGHWGTCVTTPGVSPTAATVNVKVTVDNDSSQSAKVTVATEIVSLDVNGHKTGTAVAGIAPVNLQIAPKTNSIIEGQGTVAKPKLWGPLPQQHPNRYVAITTVSQGNIVVDSYETPFGIRTLKFDPDEGFSINGQHILLNGVCDHHDLGALGVALNYRALQRQLEMLQDMGCNAIRTSHNPPAPELLELADQMGLLVMDEMFDCWRRDKTPNDYHRLFDDWHEPDMLAQIRRDRNSPSVILWSIGNEVGEQFTGAAGAALAKELSDIVHNEDPTRPTTSAINWAKANNPFPAAVDIIGLNYQGAGIRGAPGQYPAFHEKFPHTFLFGKKRPPRSAPAAHIFFPSPTATARRLAPTPAKTV